MRAFTPARPPTTPADPCRSHRRKVDWRLIPILSVLYSISLIDRTNVSPLLAYWSPLLTPAPSGQISVARLAGMAAPITPGTLATGGVALTIGERYSIISLIFFVRPDRATCYSETDRLPAGSLHHLRASVQHHAPQAGGAKPHHDHRNWVSSGLRYVP